jgi:hypothetical protein
VGSGGVLPERAGFYYEQAGVGGAAWLGVLGFFYLWLVSVTGGGRLGPPAQHLAARRYKSPTLRIISWHPERDGEHHKLASPSCKGLLRSWREGGWVVARCLFGARRT